MTPQYFVEQFGVWGLIVILAGILLKYVMKDLRVDNERNYSMRSILLDCTLYRTVYMSVNEKKLPEDNAKATSEVKVSLGEIKSDLRLLVGLMTK